jgi:O-antigen/teichoic acid export membrane protein
MNRKIGKGALLVACNQVIAEGAVLLRNIILARMLGPEQMGIVIMLAIMLRLLEMFSYLAADRLLVQAPDGHTFRFLANAHGLEVIRGLVSGLILLAISNPAAMVFGYPETVWVFALLGTIPLVRGFVHLDYRRLQRRLRFGPTIRVESLANVAGTAAIWPVLELCGDYAAIVWVNLVQALVYVGVSHWVANHRYAIRFDSEYLKRIFSFGWPMLVNSLLMFGVFQGDKLVVALSVTAQELSRYALALQLGLLPTIILGRSYLSLVLPILARKQDRNDDFCKSYDRLQLGLVCAASVFAAGYIFLGNEIITLFFGSTFSLSATVLLWIGFAMAIRIVRIGPNTAALALGDSKTLMHANLWRLGGLAAATLAGFTGMGLTAIAASAVLGELSALAASVVFLERRQRVATSIPSLFAGASLLLAITLWIYGMIPQSVGTISGFAGMFVIASLAIYFLWRATKVSNNPPQGVSL